MTDAETRSIYRRILHRETHVSRSLAVVVAMVVVVLTASLVAIAAVLVLLDERLGGVDPRTVVDAVRVAPSGASAGIVIVAGAVIVLLGVSVLMLGVLPQRRARHVIASDRFAIVVDDEVIASAAARAARAVTRLGPDAAVGTVAHRSTQVVLRPVAGMDVPVVAVTAAVEAELAAIGASPPLAARIRVRPTGRVDG